MAIIALDDEQALQEIRYMLDPSLVAAEVPDDVITARPVLKSANRWVLAAVSMTETEYDALDTDDVRRTIFEEVVIRYATRELIPVVAQLVVVNANGILTRFQEIDWEARINRLNNSIDQLLKPYSSGDTDFYGAISREKVTYGKK